MTEEDNLQKTVIAELRSLRNDMERIAGFIVEMRRDYSVLEDKMELSSSDVIRLLGISRASLARWRDTNAIPFRYISCNHVAYPFKGLYVAIKSGRASFKGFRRVEALQRSTPTRMVSLKDIWVMVKLYLRSYEHQRRNTEPNQQRTGCVLLLYAYRLCAKAQFPKSYV